MEKINQSWLKEDWCDKCNVAIKFGQPILLDIEKEYCGFIPAYCQECGIKIEKERKVLKDICKKEK